MRGGRRDDLEDQLIQVRPPEEVVAVRFQNDLPAALPTRETEGTGPDGTARRIFRARGHRLEQVLRHQRPLPGIQRRDVRLTILHSYGEVVQGRHLFDVLEHVGAGARGGVHDTMVGEEDVAGTERRPIVPAHARSKVKSQDPSAFRERPRSGQARHGFQVFPIVHQEIGHEAGDEQAPAVGAGDEVQRWRIRIDRNDQSIAIDGRVGDRSLRPVRRRPLAPDPENAQRQKARRQGGIFAWPKNSSS